MFMVLKIFLLNYRYYRVVFQVNRKSVLLVVSNELVCN